MPLFLRSPLPGNRCFAIVITLTLAVPGALFADAAHPNLVFILVDDLGKEWISCYGAEGITTPHIDELAKTGLRFDNVYSMPQCTPTRATLLTGQYPFRHGWVNHWDV
ncbi:MAG: sulfatase-like hydrolase/transferase, partial [Planctomycetaceae bacterium]|nr:sulfatase-like hydrolase/transferase [Planctomycetaceae bacterium]